MLQPHTIITHLDQKTENELPQVHINHLVVADYHQNLVHTKTTWVCSLPLLMIICFNPRQHHHSSLSKLKNMFHYPHQPSQRLPPKSFQFLYAATTSSILTHVLSYVLLTSRPTSNMIGIDDQTRWILILFRLAYNFLCTMMYDNPKIKDKAL